MSASGFDPHDGASRVFEDWLMKEARGEGEPFERVLERHPQQAAALEQLRQADGLHRKALPGSPVEAPAAPRTSGKSGNLGDFRLIRKLGEGAMGVVYEAEQISLRRTVALKVLAPHLVFHQRALKRFQNEAEITGRLHHPHIVGIHQVGEADGVHFISMELIEGTSVDRVIERMRRESPHHVRPRPQADVVAAYGLEDPDPVPTALAPRGEPTERKRGSSAASNKGYIETAVRLVCQVADALDHAHKAGVLHRDVKPSNILLRTDGNAVLTDFGLAREEGLPAISQSGDFVGTPHYVSPEQAMSGRVPIDQRSDVFSLGATLFELLTLELAFPGDSVQAVLASIVSKPPRDPSHLNPGLAPDLVTIVLKALEKDRDQRYSSAGEMAEDLRAFIDYRPIRARRTPTVVRAWRWVKREPLKAALAAGLTVGGPLLVTLGIVALRSQHELNAARLPGRIDQGFLALGIGDLAGASSEFLDVLERDPRSVEAVAGQAMVLLAQGREQEALQGLAESEREVGQLAVFERIRSSVRGGMAGKDSPGREGPAASPNAGSALERFVEAMLLVQQRPFLSGAPEASLLLVPSSPGLDRSAATTGGGRPVLLWPDTSTDTFAQARGRARQAIELLTGAIEIDADRAIYHFARAWAAWVARDPIAARRAVDSILFKWRDQPLAAFFVGLATEVFSLPDALQRYDRTIAMDPNLEAALARRATLLLRSGETERAVVELQALVERFPERVPYRVSLAMALLGSGQPELAIKSAREALNRYGDDVPARHALGVAYYGIENFERAEEVFREAVELEPTGVRLMNDHGLALLALGRLDTADAVLRRALDLDPSNPFTAYNLGLLELQRGDPESAAEAFEQSIAAYDEFERSEFSIGQAWMALGFARVQARKDPLEAFRMAVQHLPDDPAANANMGIVLWERRGSKEAIPFLEKALPVDANGRCHKALFLSQLKVGRRAECLRVALAWSDRFPEQAEAWNYRAWLQVDPCQPPVGDPADGLLAAERARDLEPGSFHMLDTHACALAANDRIAEALDVAAEARDLAELHGADAATLAEIQVHLARLEPDSE